MSTSTLSMSRATNALRHSPIPALRKLSVDESDNAVVINGCVASYYQKQLAQETVMSVLNGRALYNQVTVVRQSVESMVAAS